MSVSLAHWHRVKTLFDEVHQQPPDQRAAALDAACADDPDGDALRAEIERLLAADTAADAYFDTLSDALGADLDGFGEDLGRT